MTFLALSSKVSININVSFFLISKICRRIVQGSAGKVQWTGPAQSGGTQTEVRQIIQKEAGEVRVIVQPIQPVFYMPQQSKQINMIISNNSFLFF
jgi:hypothetical protein